MVHLGDTWESPRAAMLAIVYFLCALFIKNEKWAWGVSIGALTLHLMYNWPYNANHMVFVMVCNLYLLTWVVREEKVNFNEVLNFLFFALGVVYLIAAFHKINVDYLNPEVSCANMVVERFMGRIGIADNFLKGLLPAASIFFEFLLGCLLMIYSTRRIAIAMSLVFHFVLVWSNFVNFATIPLLFYLLYILISVDQSKSELEPKYKNLLGFYIITQMLAFLVGVFQFKFYDINISYWLAASVWTIVATIFLKFLFSFKEKLLVPKFNWLFLIFLSPLIVLGGKIYLGAGTSNSFSMFSNIRTEGMGWNHLIIPEEAKILLYQDDIYFVDQISPEYMRTVRDFPTPGMGMPELEVYRLYDIWRETTTLPPVFTLRKEGDYQSHNAVELLPPDPSPYSKWEKKFLHFRQIQYAGSNQCRW